MDNGYDGIELYPEPRCFGDVGVWRRLIIVDDTREKPREPRGDFSYSVPVVEKVRSPPNLAAL